MPVYNGRAFLRPAIDSILSQSFDDFELVIINDGSTDDSQQIIESYKDPRIVPVVQKNQGVARSLNNGLEICRGKYVRRHDADDVSMPGAFDHQVKFLESNPEYVMVSNQAAFMTEHGKPAWKYRLPRNDFFGEGNQVDLGFEHFHVDRATPVIHGTACYRREEILSVGRYRTEFTVPEDNDLWIRLIEKYKIAILRECNYLIRLHGTSATRRYAGKIRHFRQLLLDYSQERREKGTDPIMRGEPLPPAPPSEAAEPLTKDGKGKNYREDLQYIYGLVFDAGDWTEIRKYGTEIIRDGWKDSRTWKMLAFPLLGDKWIKAGVSLKSALRGGNK